MLFKTILNGLYYSGFQALCAPLTAGRGSIFALHHVRGDVGADFAPNSHLSITPEFLDAVIFRLKQQGYRFVSLDEAAQIIKSGLHDTNEKPFIAITLDDGYRDNLQNAAPVFSKHDVPYTIFVAPGMIDGDHPIWWEDLENILSTQDKLELDTPAGHLTFETATLENKASAYSNLMEILTKQVSEEDQREIIANLCKAYGCDSQSHSKLQLMTWKEIVELSKDPLCTIGAHTIGHFALARLSHAACRNEMVSSKKQLEEKLDVEISHFAYPYGYPSAAGVREFQLAEELGFKTAVTTRHGVTYPEHSEHLTALPRVSLNGSYQSLHYVRTLLSGVPTRLNNRGSKLNVA